MQGKKKKRSSSIILFLELLHTGDEKLEHKKKIWETAEINLCSQSLRVKKFNSHLQPQPFVFVLLQTLRSQPSSHTHKFVIDYTYAIQENIYCKF